MALESIAVVIGLVFVTIGIWFYVTSGWSGFRNEFALTYLFMAIPMGLGFIAVGLARSGIAGGVSQLLAWAGVALLLMAIILAYTKPARLAPEWLRQSSHKPP